MAGQPRVKYFQNHDPGDDSVEINFTKLTEPTDEIVTAMNKWGNDPELVYLSRPNSNKEELEKKVTITHDTVVERMKHDEVYLIRLDGRLVGEIEFQIDPPQLFKKDISSAWIGITIGEESARGKGIGYKAMQCLEKEIIARGLKRIELGVFEFNSNAIKLYEKLGYKEIGRVPDFTYW